MPKYRVQNLETNQSATYDLTGALRPVELLPVPYVSQLGENANQHNNDCGAACGTMLLQAYKNINLTVDRYYDKAKPRGDEYLTISAVNTVLMSYGLVCKWLIGQSLGALFEALVERKPVMVLLKYGVLANAGLTEKKNFTGPHFAVVVGMDLRQVYLNDPLYVGKGGEARPYPLDIFDRAWEAVGQDANIPNPARAMLLPMSGLGMTTQDESSSGKKPMYTATVTAKPFLFIRTGPGLNYPDAGQLNPGTRVTIYSVKNGWGEIENSHWVKLEYVAADLPPNSI